MLEVEHPAAKVLVELAQLQDEEVGDGTTSVVIIAAELLKVRVKQHKYLDKFFDEKLWIAYSHTYMCNKGISSSLQFLSNLWKHQSLNCITKN